MDPISPELVLVDPELARLARARLADRGNSNGRVSASPFADQAPRRLIVGAGAVARSVPSTVRMPLVRLREAPVAEVASEKGPRHALWPKLLLIAAGLFGFLLGVLISLIIAGDDPGPSRQSLAPGEEQAASVIPRSSTRAGSSLRNAQRTDETRTETRQSAPPAGRGSAKRKERPRKSKAAEPASSPPTRRRRGAREATRGRVPTRLFVWLPSRGARYYHVQFLKGTRAVFEAWPTDPRVTVPLRGTFRGRSFSFAKGRYRWIVRPAFGPRSKGRYGDPIVRSIWVVRP
jgi:hypothetical protein